MSNHFSASGSCLCQAVTITANSISKEVGACHCTMCRRWSGGPFIGMDCGTDVQLSGPVSNYKSSDWAERGFCRDCGTHLYYRFNGDGRYILPAGLFEENPELVFDHQLFIDEKPNYYHFAETTETMTGAEVVAAFSLEN